MFKKLSLLLGLVAALPASSFAWVGGPFDGGDFGQLMDDRGIYQTAFRFRNGSGYSQFGVNVDLAPQVTGDATGQVGGSSLGSNLNRSILYFRGVAYFGNATGMVDHDSRSVTGFGNCSSWVAIESSSDSDSGSVSVTDSIVYNSGLDNTANYYFEADITSSHPELRYSGKGELSVLTSNLTFSSNDGELVIQPFNPQEDIDREKVKMIVFGARKFFLT